MTSFVTSSHIAQLIVYILLLHNFADFIAQNQWMRKNQEDRLAQLFAHSVIYMTILLFGLLITGIFPFPVVFMYSLANGFCHWVTDFITGIAAYDCLINKRPESFQRLTGIDQFAHQVALIFTLSILGVAI